MRNRSGAIMSLVLTASLAAAAAACGTEFETERGPEGVQTTRHAIGSPNPTPTNIWTLDHLNVNVRNNPNGNFRLTGNIDLGPAAGWNGGAGWQPIVYFNGTLDGNGFQIRNLTINRPEGWSVALFGQVDQAIIRNVGVTNVNVRGNAFVGGLAGIISDSQVTSSYAEGTVTASTGQFGAGLNVGVFAGQISSSEVTRSYARGTVTGAATVIGGFAGSIDDAWGSRSVVRECYARTEVTPSMTTSTVAAGGLAGQAVNSEVVDVYAMGNTSANTVQGRGKVGGVIGEIIGTVQFDFAFSRNRVVDWAVALPNGKAGTYGLITGDAVIHISALFWDRTIDSGNVFGTVSQGGFTTGELQGPTTAAAWPYDNGTDSDYDSTVWNAGTSSQYHILRRVVRASQQSAN
jgi:hypothetical protein